MGTVVLVFRGEYDATLREDLRNDLEALEAEPGVILNLAEVTYMDSTCIGEFVRLQTARTKRGLGPLRIVRSASIIKRLFDLLKLDRIFVVADTLDDALPKNGNAVEVRYAVRGSGSPEESLSGS